MKEWARIISRLAEAAILTGSESITSHGVCQYAELSFGCRVYTDPDVTDVLGVKGWVDGVLRTALRSYAHNALLIELDDGVFAVNCLFYSEGKDHWVEFIRIWTKESLRENMFNAAVLVKNKLDDEYEEEYFHIPFWRKDATERLPNPEELAAPMATVLPLLFEGEHALVGNRLPDKYGIMWRILGMCDGLVVVENEEQKQFMFVPGALGLTRAYTDPVTSIVRPWAGGQAPRVYQTPPRAIPGG